MSKGTYTHSEIYSQPDIWKSVLDDYAKINLGDLIDNKDITGRYFLVTGCGSTHYLAMSTATLLRKLGFRASALPASEVVYFSQALPPGEANLLAISRSGTTTETLWAVEKYRKQKMGNHVIAITTQPNSTLAKEADFILAAPQAQEISTAQTRSFTSMFLISQILSGALAGDRNVAARLLVLPDGLTRLLEEVSDLTRLIGEDLSINRFFFLGGGPFYGLACEAMLKMKEMSCSWTEAYHPLEFRHGPMSVVDQGSLVVCLASDSQLAAEARVLNDMKCLGAKTLVITEDSTTSDWSGMDYVISMKTGLDEWDRGAIYLPLIQWIAYYRSISKGLDPDQPNNLSPVIELDND
jgi:glucosamine--fructose-6-phosphate aminotransferase (isomerizing)